MVNLYYSFNRYLREKFGERVQRISIDAGLGCPNIDGKLSSGGCIYCNNKGFGVYASSNKPIEEQIIESIKFYEKRSGIKKFIAYFQSFSNTYSDLKTLKEKYGLIRKFPQIVGLFISTRPDCINEDKIKLIAGYSKNYLVWIEYGLQTTHNRLLKTLNRNHTYKDFLKAHELTRKYKISVGVHLILGLPTANHKDMVEDADKLAKLDIQGIKFHVLHVLKNTQLEEPYKRGQVKLLTQEEYVRIVCNFLEKIPSSVIVLRLVSDASCDCLVAPLWINKKLQVINDIEKELKKRETSQGHFFNSAF